MLIFIALAFIYLKIIGMIDVSWTIVILGVLVLLIGSLVELRYVYKKINQRFK